jgi:hypothetical protein
LKVGASRGSALAAQSGEVAIDMHTMKPPKLTRKMRLDIAKTITQIQQVFVSQQPVKNATIKVMPPIFC